MSHAVIAELWYLEHETTECSSNNKHIQIFLVSDNPSADV